MPLFLDRKLTTNRNFDFLKNAIQMKNAHILKPLGGSILQQRLLTRHPLIVLITLRCILIKMNVALLQLNFDMQ